MATAEFNFDAPIAAHAQNMKDIDCEISIEHALVHLQCAMEDYPEDLDQIAHDLGIVFSILKVLKENEDETSNSTHTPR